MTSHRLPAICLLLAGAAISFAGDPNQQLERTCFQTDKPWNPAANLPGDAALCYKLDPTLPDRIRTWRDHGYVVHMMTGVAWGNYQDYLYGKFDGINHEDEAQMNAAGIKIAHGDGGRGDIYYMGPCESYGKMLAAGIQPALDAGVEAVHLEEPEYWVAGSYAEGFKRQWQSWYHEPWQDPALSADAQWRASKLKYYLFRQALQQVFNYVQDYNRRTGRHVRCYVATHSLISYAQFGIVSPESSLALLDGCDGYIAQVWSDTARIPNRYRGILHMRMFEAAFLEYGAMQNLVRSTGRRVWYLNDPASDLPGFAWAKYQSDWQATMAASLLQPEVWRYELAPWPERIFNKVYPTEKDPNVKEKIPASYATVLQTVMHALNNMNQKEISWDCGTPGIGVTIGDSLMFQRGGPHPSDKALGHFYGLAMPLVEHGLPVTPVQLENVALKHYLDPFHVLFLSYQGMKPLKPEVNVALADWVRAGGTLIVWDDDSDPYNSIREWWNTGNFHYANPREHLFEQLGLPKEWSAWSYKTSPVAVGSGSVFWIHQNPVDLASDAGGDAKVIAMAKAAVGTAHLEWKETNYLMLRRGPYIIAAGMNESPVPGNKELHGRFINLFDGTLSRLNSVKINPQSCMLLLDLDHFRNQKPCVVAMSGFSRSTTQNDRELTLAVQGVGTTPGVVLIHSTAAPASVTLDGTPLKTTYSKDDQLLRIDYTNDATPHGLTVKF